MSLVVSLPLRYTPQMSTLPELTDLCRSLMPEEGSYPPQGLLPLVVDLSGFKDADELLPWLDQRRDQIQARLLECGAIWFRCADVVKSAADFEKVAKVLEPELATAHPFDDGRRRWRGEHVWEAGANAVGTRLASMVLPFHNEDGYIPVVPRRLLFCCVSPPALGGETVLVDCRRVLADIPRRTLKRLEAISYPSKKILPIPVVMANARVATAAQAEELARTRSGAHVTVEADNLVFTSSQRTVSEHPDTGERVWANRLANRSSAGCMLDLLFGIPKAKAGLRLHTFLTTLRIAGWTLGKASVLSRLSRERHPSPISLVDTWNIVRAHWKNAVVVHWRAGDIVLIENRLVAHGRLPFRGVRDIVGALVPGNVPSRPLPNGLC